MTGYIHSFESFGTSDGPGIRFVVFLQGCPMRGLYCHNPDTRDFFSVGESGGEKNRLGRAYEAQRVLEEILKYEKYISSGGVTVSGGEPLMQADLGVAFAKDRADDLPQRLTETFREMLADGTTREIVSRYLDEPDHYLEGMGGSSDD